GVSLTVLMGYRDQRMGGTHSRVSRVRHVTARGIVPKGFDPYDGARFFHPTGSAVT
ncbi:MAG: hypothetical protein RL469_1502, partial [Pseudomonadota bacterium]